MTREMCQEKSKAENDYISDEVGLLTCAIHFTPSIRCRIFKSVQTKLSKLARNLGMQNTMSKFKCPNETENV